MLGICVAVNATTSTSARSRKTTLKLWKSRPAAPAMSTRVAVTGAKRTWVESGRGPVPGGDEQAGCERVRGLAAVRGHSRVLRLGDAAAARRALLPPGGRGAEPRADARPVPARRRPGGCDPGRRSAADVVQRRRRAGRAGARAGEDRDRADLGARRACA